MKHLALATLLISFTSAAQAEVFGKFTDEKLASQPLKELVAQSRTDKTVITEGTVKQVCEVKGCWMKLEDKGQTVRVFFKGHSFFVGKNLVGKKVKTEGVLQKKTQSVAEQKHFLEDAGAPKAEIEKIKAPLDTYVFEATAVATL